MKNKLKRRKGLTKLRQKWKSGFTSQVKDPPISTKSSVRTISGGLPGNKR